MKRHSTIKARVNFLVIGGSPGGEELLRMLCFWVYRIKGDLLRFLSVFDEVFYDGWVGEGGGVAEVVAIVGGDFS